MTLPSQPRALREPSKQFSRQCRIGLFVPYISSVVLQEIARASARDADQMVVEINRLAPVELTPSAEVEQLAAEYVKAGIVPSRKRDDARHVALATVSSMEILVSWNHRHLANKRKKELFNAVNKLAGRTQPLEICTPFEVLQ